MTAPTRLLRSPSQVLRPPAAGRLQCLFASQELASRGSRRPSTRAKTLITFRETPLQGSPEVWFSPTLPSFKDSSQPPLFSSHTPDDNKAKLGKTLVILQERLPTLLQSPLPQEVLSPTISLHLFPSTHPHLPAVSGRVAYKAALWTSPIAWNRLPVVGNVRLEILTERMVRGQPARRAGAIGEQLIVRWRTTSGEGGGGGGGLPFLKGVGEEGKDFTGLFIFEFDRDGRILSHTIEHVNQDGQWEKGVGAKVVGLTDWLLGGIKGGREGDENPCPAFAGKER